MMGKLDFFKKELFEFALNSGFSSIAISSLNISEYKQNFLEWIANKNNANMAYLEKEIDLRFLEKEHILNQKVAIVGLFAFPLNYSAHIASYALLDDYHSVIKRGPLLKVSEFLKEKYPKINILPFVDSGNISERSLAASAGLGSISKSGMLISKEFGINVFIGGLIVDVDIASDKPINWDPCKSCDICFKSCPTNTILDNKKLNANKCISYLTIERSLLDIEENTLNTKNNLIESHVFGCDECIIKCPHVKKDLEQHSLFTCNTKLANSSLLDLKEMAEESFKKNFSKTSISRLSKNRFLKRIKIVEENNRKCSY